MTDETREPAPAPLPDERWDAEAEEAAAESRRSRGSLRWWLVGGVLVAIASAITVWFVLAGSEAAISSQVVAYEAGERQLDVTIEVTRPAGTAVSCTVAAVDRKHASVGTREVAIPAGEEETTRASTTVRTTTTPANVVIRACRATG